MRYSLFAIWFLFSGMLSAQGLSWALDVGAGGLIRHSKRFAFPSSEMTWSGDVSIQWRTSDRQAWAQYHRYPLLGWHFRYHTFGNQAILGGVYSSYPSFHLPLWSSLWGGQLDFMLGSGVSYVTRPYDPFGNPENTAIGSHWNNIARIKLQYSRPMSAGGAWGVHCDFTHVSNGRISSPNTGLNTAQLGLWVKGGDRLWHEGEPGSDSWRIRKWSAEGGGILSWTSHSVYSGPSFPVYVIFGAITRSLSPVQRLHIGVERERNMERAHFMRGMLGIVDRSEALNFATSYLLYVGDEILFGPVSVGFIAGIYLQTEGNKFPVYNKLFARYYFLHNKRGSGPFLALYLKSHLATAEYIGVGMGYQY